MPIDMINDKPGPEFDLRIHELFGHSTLGYELRGKRLVKHTAGINRWMDLPEYSTTWNGMQLVVEEMQRRGWDYLASSLTNGNHAMRFDKYSIIDGREVEKTARADAPALPHATALAALKALEGSQS